MTQNEARRAPRTALLISTAIAGMALVDASWAQQTAKTTEDSVVITGAQPRANIDRLPQPIEDLPQTVHVLDGVTLKQQNAVSLDQAVRNVPGITANTGEGGGAVAGDQFRIRGFDAQNDISSDGLRDFGVYTRDNFNVESVQVFLGPSGQTFGRGSFGGAINTSTKAPRLNNFGEVSATGGDAPMLRVTGDWNRRLGDHSAIRLNVMGHLSEFADIEEAQSNRWGFAGALGFGIDTDTSFTLNYFHQTDDRVPYYGVPVVAAPGQTIARPLPVDRSTFYGTEHDRDDTKADVVTARFKHRFNDVLQISNDTRVGVFSREFMAVAPNCNNNGPSTCLNDFFDGAPGTVPIITRGGANGPYFLDQWGAQNVTTLIADFDLGGFENQFVAGADFTYESADRLNTNAYQPGGATFPRPGTPALDPDPTWLNPSFIATSERETSSTNAALFVSDQVWFSPQWSVLAGIRWDRYAIYMDTTTFGAVNSTTGVFTPASPATVVGNKVKDDLFSPRVSLIWEPDENKIFYASWARSAQPATGTASASVGTPISSSIRDLDPTTSETYEIGGRIGVLANRLDLGVSIFQTERDNAKETDPITGGVLASGDQQRARGVELSATGHITDRWQIQASYTLLDTETLLATAACSTALGAALPCPVGVTNGSAVPNPAAIGKPIPFAAENAATLWTTYNPTDALTLGLGARYTEAVWLNNTNTAQAPDYISVDALAAYSFDSGVTVQANVTNLLDRDENYDQVVGGRAAHAPGRAFTLTLSRKF